MRARNPDTIDPATTGSRRLGVVVALMAAVGWAMASAAVSIPGETHVSSPSPDARVPLVIGQGIDQAAVVTLAASSVAESHRLEAMRERNQLGVLPLQNGITRTFDPVTVTLNERAPLSDAPRSFAGGDLVVRNGRVVWSTAVEVVGAYAIRLHLEHAKLPAGTTIFVADHAGGVSDALGTELLTPDGDMWLPPVFGATARLEVQVDHAAITGGDELRFSLGEVAELIDLAADADVWTDCDIDATCVGSGTLSVISDYREAVAHLLFMVGPGAYICSGALVNDAVPGTPIPYLLTANHCFSTQASASSLTSYFDFRSSTCNGSPPSLNSVPHVSGSTLLATNASSDFTFVELSSNPAGTNYYLGWDTAAPTGGTTLHRVSHPAGTAQKYSAGSFNATGGITCTGLPRPNFLYTSAATGSTTGGSSGAPVIKDTGGGQIVGQLYGTCHFTTWDNCSYGTFNWVDGAFATTYSSISAWLGSASSIFTDGFESGNTAAWSSTVP